jgi:hypothetical protein
MIKINLIGEFKQQKRAKKTCLWFSKYDVAEAIGVHPASLSRICNRDNIDLKRLNLLELIEFVMRYRTHCPNEKN